MTLTDSAAIFAGPYATCDLALIVPQASRMSQRSGSHAFYGLASPAWGNVVALTVDDDVILVRPYRHVRYMPVGQEWWIGVILERLPR